MAEITIIINLPTEFETMFSMQKRLSTIIIISASLMAQSAYAADWTEKVTIKGFASAVYQQTDDPVFFNGDCARTFTGPIPDSCDGTPGGEPGTVNGVTPANGGINEDGSFRRTRIGLNINANINERVTLQTQFLVLEEEDEYKMHLDWGFISLAINDEHTIRAGKIKLPVGLVNEFQSVGFAFPWIEAPQLFYTADFNGANITRESYRGLSYLWQTYVGDWAFSTDIFWGNIALEGMSLNGMLGATLKAEWDDSVYVQASTYSGDMLYEPRMSAMLNGTHQVATIGIGGDINGFLFYSEYANVTMDMDMQESTTWYASAGYTFDEVTLLVTHQNMDKGVNVPEAMKNAQTMDSITLRYDVFYNTALKFELSKIDTEKGVGLFAAGAATDIKPADSVNMFGMALEVIF